MEFILDNTPIKRSWATEAIRIKEYVTTNDGTKERFEEMEEKIKGNFKELERRVDFVTQHKERR